MFLKVLQNSRKVGTHDVKCKRKLNFSIRFVFLLPFNKNMNYNYEIYCRLIKI